MYRPQLPCRPQPQLPAPEPRHEVLSGPLPIFPDAGYPKPPQQPLWIPDATPWLREPGALGDEFIAA